MEFVSDRRSRAKSKKSETLFPSDGPGEDIHDVSLHITRETGSKVIVETEGKWW
jgi:hypothetical protein